MLSLSNLTKKYAKLVIKPNKENNSQIVANCPLCGDTKGRLSIAAVKDENGVARCFNGGCIAENGLPFSAFLKEVDESLYNQYRKEKFNENLGISENKNLDNILDKVKSKKTEKIKKTETTTEEIVSVFEIDFQLPKIFNLQKVIDTPKAIEYLENRNISKNMTNNYKNWYFSENKFVTVLDKHYFVENFIFIPIIQNKKLKGFYTRSIEEKRFSTIIFPSGDKFWCSKIEIPQKCYVFEGIFDAISSGFENVIAMLSASIPETIPDNEFIYVFDNDATGKKKALEKIEMNRKVFVWPEIWQDFKDINEVLCNGFTNKEISKIIEENVFSGIKAKIRLEMARV